MCISRNMHMDRQKHKKIVHKPHAKKECLFLCLPPHYAHPKGAWKRMIHGILENAWRYLWRIDDYKDEVKKLFNGLINIG